MLSNWRGEQAFSGKAPVAAVEPKPAAYKSALFRRMSSASNARNSITSPDVKQSASSDTNNADPQTVPTTADSSSAAATPTVSTSPVNNGTTKTVSFTDTPVIAEPSNISTAIGQVSAPVKNGDNTVSINTDNSTTPSSAAITTSVTPPPSARKQLISSVTKKLTSNSKQLHQMISADNSNSKPASSNNSPIATPIKPASSTLSRTNTGNSSNILSALQSTSVTTGILSAEELNQSVHTAQWWS